MSLSKDNLEIEIQQLLVEKTIALKSMQYERVSQLRVNVNSVLIQLEKLTSEEYIKIRWRYIKKERGYFPLFES